MIAATRKRFRFPPRARQTMRGTKEYIKRMENRSSGRLNMRRVALDLTLLPSVGNLVISRLFIVESGGFEVFIRYTSSQFEISRVELRRTLATPSTGRVDYL